MKLVIDIPEERYRLYKFKAEHHVSDAQFDLHNIIAKGKPLPEHHGRLIDADSFVEEYGEYYAEEGSECGYIGDVKGLIQFAPTVIKATENTNKEESK